MLPLLVAAALTATVPGSLSPSGSRTMTIAADARVGFRPNQVIASFLVNATSKDQATARRVGEEKLRKVLDALVAAGAQPRDLLTPDGAPQAEYRGNEIVAWNAARVVTATLTDMARVDEALAAAVKAGGQPTGAVTVRHSDTRPFETKARIAAAATARERAAGIVEALGGKLGAPRVVSESGQPNQGQSMGALVVGPDGKVTTGFATVELFVLGQVHVQFDIQDTP